MASEITLNGKPKPLLKRLNGWTKLIVGGIPLIGGIWGAATWVAGVGAGIEAGKVKNSQQDSCIADIKATQGQILYRLIRKDIQDSLTNAARYEQSKAIADSMHGNGR